eukprot:m.86292 g.86292  ORF g.86292 m.86292 type:complete len:123 (-) comp19836_c2_seq1:201-569(-)
MSTVETIATLESGSSLPKSPKLKPAEMIGGRRRPAGHPTKEDVTVATAPSAIVSLILPVDEPEPDVLIETEMNSPKTYKKMPKYDSKHQQAYMQPNVKRNTANGGLQGGIQRPQNVGTHGWS